MRSTSYARSRSARPRGIRIEDRHDPAIIEPTDAIIRLSATCICGSDLWRFRGVEEVHDTVMGHEYVGVEEIGADVKNVHRLLLPDDTRALR